MDFTGIIAASKNEQIRAWSIEQASRMSIASGGSVDAILTDARKIEDHVYAKDREKEYLAGEEKVSSILRDHGHSPNDISSILQSFKNAHICFLEVKQ